VTLLREYVRAFILTSVPTKSGTPAHRLCRREAVWREWLCVTSLLALLGSQAVTASENNARLVKEKPRGQSIHFEVVIPALPEDVFASWTTEAGANQFFGKASTIQQRVGGLYEIKFDGELPNGNAPGTTGTHILYFDRNKALAFEWQAPFFADELNTSPLPTWVELTFESHSGQDRMTVLRLDHYGFGTGDTWDRVRTFFEINWFEVLFRLRTLYEQESGASTSVEFEEVSSGPGAVQGPN
jgi:uncharacterized protein YndB with AHSA1/START domain